MNSANKAAERQRRIQRQVDSNDASASPRRVEAMQAGARAYPAPPFPKQHHPKPGHESEIEPARCTRRPSGRDRESSIPRLR